MIAVINDVNAIANITCATCIATFRLTPVFELSKNNWGGGVDNQRLPVPPIRFCGFRREL